MKKNVCALRENGTVDIKLVNHQSNDKVFWSPRKVHENGRATGMNSYVIVPGIDSWNGVDFLFEGQKVRLLSINGIGEIRWEVFTNEISQAKDRERLGTLNPTWDMAEHLLAARYFGLSIQSEV